MQRLDAQAHRGKQSAGFGTIRRYTDLPKQAKERLARLGSECLQAPELRRLQIANIACDGDCGLDFSQRTPGGIEELSVVPRSLPCRPLRDVEGNAVGRPPQLVSQRMLLEVRKPLGNLRALNRESFGMLPCLERVMDWHDQG